MPNIHSNISFALVNIPVIMNPIIKNNDTSFNQLHTKCLNRIKYLKYCPHCKKNVKETEIVKGYAYLKDEYIVFEKKELDKLKPENEKLIDVIGFVNISEIDPTYYQKSYYLKTDSKSKAYYLFVEALKKTKKVALAKTVLGNKFYYCIIRFAYDCMVLTTLYFAEEVNIPSGEKEVKKIIPKEMDLAVKLIQSMQVKFTPEKYLDEYQNNIKKAIDTKLKGKKISSVKRKPRTQVNDLLTALEKSLKETK